MTQPQRSKLRRFLRDTIEVFNKNKTSWVGLILLAIMVTVALLAPWLAPYNPVEQHIVHRLQPASAAYWLGTDQYGRDILSRIIWGSRISLTVGVFSILLGMVLGGAFGLLAGYKGGLLDNLIMRVMDVFMSFPTLILGLLIVAVLGASLTNLIVAIALTVAPRFARIARAPTVTVKERDFVEAGRAMGFSDLRIMVVHILPNIIGEILVMASLWIATAVRIEASLSFIGLGVKPPIPTWGGMIREGFEFILDAPWLSVYPGVVILITVFAFNMLGDGLRDALDPKLRR
jgi:peptide/nickel transport system permease protein